MLHLVVKFKIASSPFNLTHHMTEVLIISDVVLIKVLTKSRTEWS